MNAIDILQRIIWYSEPFNGAGPNEWVEAAFGRDIHPDYRREKVRVAQRGLLHFAATLDGKRRERLVSAMLEKYP